jgi:hypothetical protein
LIPLVLWFIAALNPMHGRDIAGAVIVLLQAEGVAALACLLAVRRLRYVGYGLLTPLPITLFLLLAL